MTIRGVASPEVAQRLRILGVATVLILAACTDSTTIGTTTTAETSTSGPPLTSPPTTDNSVTFQSSTSTTATSRLFQFVQGDIGRVVNFDKMTTAAGACHLRTAADGYALPDPTCTPGVIAARVNQANITQTICVPGYTAGVRPSASATNRVKALNYIAYGQTASPFDENDHLIALELGGANDPRNLWNEPPAVGQTTRTNAKDQIENTLHARVCTGRLQLADAQRLIATDWTTALNAG